MKSTTGYVILYQGGPIHWKTQKQPLVALSSTEAELVSICTLVKDIVWIRMLASELGAIDKSPTTIYCDNQSAIKLAYDEGSVQRTRHMGVRAAFVREQIQDKQIAIKHIAGDEQAADFLTKPLTTAKFCWNRNFLMSLLAVVTLCCIIVSGITFERTSPLIWLSTRHFVDDGVTEYDVMYSVVNPCESLRKAYNLPAKSPVRQAHPPGGYAQQFVPAQEPNRPLPQHQALQQVPPQHPQVIQQQQQLGQAAPNQVGSQLNPVVPQPATMQEVGAEYIINECEAMWTSTFRAKLDELTSRVPKIRRPRGVLGEVIETAAKFAAYGCVSNLISTVIEELNPNSNTNQIKDTRHNQEILKTNVEAMKARIHDFEVQFNVTREVEKGLIDQVVTLTRIQNRQQHQINLMAEMIPRISWMSAYIMTKITQATADLQSVADEYSRGRVACRELGNLLGLDELKGHENGGTSFDSITKLGPFLLRLQFSTRAPSESTFVYKISAFKYWDHLTDVPTLMEYQGYKDIIYNHSNNCLRAIEEPQQDAVLETCEDANSTDSRLTIWQPLAKTRDLYAYNHTCQVKRTAAYNYIYCFPFEIRTSMGTFKNPPHAYRLPLKIGFELPASNFRYTPVIRKLNLSGPFEAPAVDSISTGHFDANSDALDEVKWFDKMQALMVENENLKLERSKSISIERHGGAFWTIIVFILWCRLGSTLTGKSRKDKLLGVRSNADCSLLNKMHAF